VIPCDGQRIDEYQVLLEGILGSIREPGGVPAGYVLIDSDRAIPTHKPQDHVKYLQLQCHEAENLYLTDEILNKLGITWAEGQERIMAVASDYGEKAAALATYAQWDRKNVDLKGLMTALSEILDPKRLLWTVRVGQALGEHRPIGQLAEFLGSEAVDALWQPQGLERFRS
jgi:hypothetical protein